MSGSCLIRGMEITKDLNSHSDATTILYLDEDLGTRWINGMRGRLTDATYSLSIPIGMAQKPLTEIVNEWLEQYPKSRLLVLSEVAPAVQTQHPERISYRHFSCN